MFSIKKVDNEDLENSFLDSIRRNDDAIDYVQNRQNVVQSALKYNENDKLLQDENIQLEYIHFVLKYVGEMYEKGLKKVR